jgi:hypothetical protein
MMNFTLTNRQEAKALKADAIEIMNRIGDRQDQAARDDRAIAQAMLDSAAQYLQAPLINKYSRVEPNVRPKSGVVNWDGAGSIGWYEKSQNAHTKLIMLVRRNRDDQDKQAS